MNGLFEIAKITHKDGTDRIDGRYPIRIGRRCRLHLNGCGYVAHLEYIPKHGEDYSGMLRTSVVEDIEATVGVHKITTMNSIYYLQELY